MKLNQVEIIEGQPLVVFDNKGKTFDRFTVAFLGQPAVQWVGGKYRIVSGYFSGLGMSENPFHPQGFGQGAEVFLPNKSIGKRIAFSNLPAPCQQMILEDIAATNKALIPQI